MVRGLPRSSLHLRAMCLSRGHCFDSIDWFSTARLTCACLAMAWEMCPLNTFSSHLNTPCHGSCSGTMHSSVQLQAATGGTCASTRVHVHQFFHFGVNLVLFNTRWDNRHQEPWHHEWLCTLCDVQSFTDGQLRHYQSASDFIFVVIFQLFRMQACSGSSHELRCSDANLI